MAKRLTNEERLMRAMKPMMTVEGTDNQPAVLRPDAEGFVELFAADAPPEKGTREWAKQEIDAGRPVVCPCGFKWRKAQRKCWQGYEYNMGYVIPQWAQGELCSLENGWYYPWEEEE
jgi:hypothetical protein